MSSSPKWESDVFVSCKRGGQVHTFILGLFEPLKRVGIGYFEDDNTEEAQANSKGKRHEALQQVKFALVVFCKNYVNCNRCLDGLAELIKLKEGRKLVVIPIYFLTDRTVVSNWASNGKTAVALESTEVSRRAAKKEEWKNALKEAVEIPGYYLRATDDELKKLIEKIVERLVNEIHFLYPKKVFGPFGSKDGISWRSNKVDGIYVDCMDRITSMALEAKDVAHTNDQGDNTYKVKFENGEYITSFAGYFDDDNKRITWLTFRTNKRMLRSFGEMKGEYFSVPSTGWKVIEFFGGGNDFLTSIGARVERDSEKFRRVNVQRVGLIGIISGSEWDDGHNHANVRKIIVEHDSSRVQSIKFQYVEKNRGLPLLKKHGLDGNNFTTGEIEMDPDEYLTSIFAVCNGDGIIKALTFLTNKKRIETIRAFKGDISKDTVTTLTPDGKIVGFFGWSDGHLCGIGAYAEQKPFKSADTWEDGEFFGVREISLFREGRDANSCHIRYIRFVYDDGSEKGRSVIHGDFIEEGLIREKTVKLNYPHEYLTSISGHTREDGVIQSVKFYSNTKTHNPYAPPVKEEKEKEKGNGKGEWMGKGFWYPPTGSKITGFYGTFVNKTLKSIGVYAETIPHISPFKKIGPFGGTDGIDWDDGVHVDVRAFRVGVSIKGDVLHSISFMYDDNGSLVEGREHGRGDAGTWIWLDCPIQRLSSITVWKVEVEKEKETIITRLKITTTITDTSGLSTTKHYGPYPSGEPSSEAVQHDIEFADHKMVGFFGRAGRSYLNAIGAHLEQS